MHIVIELRGRAVRPAHRRRQRTMLQPARGARIAIGIGFLHPVAHPVIDKADGVAERIDTPRQLLVLIPLIAPALAALIDKARDQPLRVPEMLTSQPVVLLNGGQTRRQVIFNPATVAGAGAVFHHAPVIQLLPAVFAFQAARQAVPDHQPVVVIAVFAGGHAAGVDRCGQLTVRIVAPGHQRPTTYSIKMAGAGNALRKALVIVGQRNVDGAGFIMDAYQSPQFIPSRLQAVAVLIAQRSETQLCGIGARWFKQPPGCAIVVSNRHVAVFITAHDDTFADAVKDLIYRRQGKTQLAARFIEPGRFIAIEL